MREAIRIAVGLIPLAMIVGAMHFGSHRLRGWRRKDITRFDWSYLFMDVWFVQGPPTHFNCRCSYVL